MGNSSRRLLDPLFLVENTQKLDKKTKKKITVRLKMVKDAISQIEKMTGISYPDFYVDPILTLSVSPDDYGGIGILYARTIPIESEGMVKVLVQVSAALLLSGTKTTFKLILAHEFLHYVELVRQFTSGSLSSDTSPSYLFEERYKDAERAVDPQTLFPKQRKLAGDLSRMFQGGFTDEKLNEKCRTFWIEKGLPAVKIPVGENQVRISMEVLANSTFDPKVVELVSRLNSGK